MLEIAWIELMLAAQEDHDRRPPQRGGRPRRGRPAAAWLAALAALFPSRPPLLRGEGA